MVLAKTSRKGKKAWRRNVDASAEEAVLAAAPLPGDGKRVAAGGGKALPDVALFFEDKVGVGVVWECVPHPARA
jgi:oligoribonuclease NrnB/cAMP/cGMP phosphodiesterase (DHH superfamily)